MNRTTWLRIAIGGGAFGLSVLAGVGVGALTDGDSTPDPLEGIPVAERPTDVLEPLTQGEAPTDEDLDVLAAGMGGGGGGTGGGGGGTGGGSDVSFTGIGAADSAEAINELEIPDDLLGAVCGDDPDAGCTDFVGRTLDEYAEGIEEDAAEEDEEPADGEGPDESDDTLIELLCFDPELAEICFDAIGEFRDFILEGLGDGDGGSGDDEAPVLIDLCAENPDLPGCEEGVVGTVTLAITIPVEIYLVDGRLDLTTFCASGPAPGSDEFVLMVVANQPVAISGTYAPTQPDGSLGEGSPFSGEATAEARAWSDAHPEDPRSVTCALLPKPAPDSGVLTYQVDFEATGDSDAVPASWSGPVDIPRVSAPTPPPPPEPDEEPEPVRPPTEVTPINARELHVDVYVTPDETASAWLVARDPENPGTSRCGAFYAGELSIPDHTPAVLDRISPVGSATEPYTNRARLWATTITYRPGPHDVCVEVKDDFDPPRVVDRHHVLVGVPEQLDFEVFVAGYRHADTGDGPDLPRITDINLEVIHGFNVCRADLSTADLVSGGEQDAFCTMSLPADATSLGALARTRFGEAAGHTRRALLQVPREGCPGFPPGECPTFYEIHLLGPRSSDSREKHGILILGLRPMGAPGSTSWGIGLPEPDETDEADDDIPRLDTGSLTVELDPANPTAGIVVGWQADQEVTAEVSAHYFPTFADRDEPCRDAGNRQIASRQASDGPATEGRVTISGLCSGARYRVDVVLVATDEDGRSPRRVLYTSAEGASGEGTRLLDWRRTSVRTEPVLLELSYDVEYSFSSIYGAPEGGGAYIPAPLRVTVGAHESGVDQEYYGRARLELACALIADFNHSEGPITTESRNGSVLVRTDMRLYRWNGRGECPDAGDQITGKRSSSYGPTSMSGSEGDFVSVYRLLDAGEATVHTGISGRSARINTTIHLTAREADVFRADDSVAEAAG